MQQLSGYSGAGGPSYSVDFSDLDEQLRFLRKMVSGPQVKMRDAQGVMRLVGDYRAHPAIRELALSIITGPDGARQRDKKRQAIVIGQWVQDHIYYVHEMPERFQTPIETLRLRAGDCDDSTTLVGSLLETIGIPAQLVCMQVDGVWKHIFPAAVMQNGSLLPLDTTMRDSPIDSVLNPTMWAQQRGKSVKIKLA